MKFVLKSSYKPTGDQPAAIEQLAAGVRAGKKHQTLLGVTGSGKTFTMANVIERLNRPALVISHNKTLALQLYQEFKEFFPLNAVHYFVSYYDYYQPEAYLPTTDTYIEKDAKLNDFIDRLRHATTASALTRRDFVICASVSCIYGLGDPEEYENVALELKVGQTIKRKDLTERLADLYYERNDTESRYGTFSAKGDVISIASPDGATITEVELLGDKIDAMREYKNDIHRSGERAIESKHFFPAKHFVTPKDKLKVAMANIRTELATRLTALKKAGKILEAARLEQRVNFDLEMLETTGYVSGIENYSRQLSFRNAGEPPFTLLDYLPDDTLVIIDESHMTVPQIGGMYAGDQARKNTLVNYGFRLPSALDNRPLKFAEFDEKAGQRVYVSATPAQYEIDASGSDGITEQLIRPTGLLDPKIEIRPARNQLKDVEQEIAKCVAAGERALVVTLTKRLAEDIAAHFKDAGIKAEYMHSEIKTLERGKILEKLRRGEIDVLIGINLLREGLDLPEVALIAILDADKEGFLRNETSLIQTIGRGARHPKGRAILYADIVTGSIQRALDETNRRRKIQEDYNRENNITPTAVIKPIRAPLLEEEKDKRDPVGALVKDLYETLKDHDAVKVELERQMLIAADELRFEDAARLRDVLKTL
ncbi:MAG: excinuclease ABC subunit UvrB [Candidatus Niyogibacteria bacterium]|nr:excinuclease ABC subunit UvrB [Candidatus Niyogibacteria bacterium]